MAEVSIRNVEKSYGTMRVIHGIDVAIADGSFVVLVGPSGCGKSTLLRIIAGLEDVTGGQILIDGVEVNDLPPKSRDIAMVFQNYGLYPHMTVAQNMGFALKLQRVPKSDIRDRVNRAAEILNLGPLLDRYPRQLSGGQRQRVAMGRAIVRDPKVFLFDEPLSNLDAKLRVQMRAEIKQLHQRLKTTTVYVTHDQIEAMTMAEVIVVMNEGLVMQAGPPLTLYDRPENLFVAGFIGSPSMNFFSGTVEAAGNNGSSTAVLRTEDGETIALPDVGGIEPGKPVVLGIRPEDLVLDENGSPAEVKVVEPTGAEVHVMAHMAGREVTVVFRDRHLFDPGQIIHLTPRPGKLHLFDPKTELRLN